MANNIIDSTDSGIVVKETLINLSDEKLRGILSRTYEKAQQDMGTPKFRKFYGVFLSISGTLFLSLLTSTFNSVGRISSDMVTVFVWIICVICAILGFALMALTVSDKMKNNTEQRDETVDKMFEQYFLKK